MVRSITGNDGITVVFCIEINVIGDVILMFPLEYKAGMIRIAAVMSNIEDC